MAYDEAAVGTVLDWNHYNRTRRFGNAVTGSEATIDLLLDNQWMCEITWKRNRLRLRNGTVDGRLRWEYRTGNYTRCYVGYNGRVDYRLLWCLDIRPWSGSHHCGDLRAAVQPIAFAYHWWRYWTLQKRRTRLLQHIFQDTRLLPKVLITFIAP